MEIENIFGALVLGFESRTEKQVKIGVKGIKVCDLGKNPDALILCENHSIMVTKDADQVHLVFVKEYHWAPPR